jgi:uncharacterized protein with PIN domain
MADVLDAYAIVALIADEPAAPAVEDMLRGGSATTTSINFAEAVGVISRVHRQEERRVREVVDPLVLDGALAVIAPDVRSAWRAGELRTRYYDRRSCALSIADCFLLAAAGPADRIATSDPAIAQVARAEGLAVMPLPDSAGRRP